MNGTTLAEAVTIGEQPTRLTTVATGASLGASKRAGIAVEVVDGFNVITARHLERLAGGELLTNGPPLDWARLMRRTPAVDPLRCPRCDGRLRPIAEITEPDVIARILEHIADRAPPNTARPVSTISAIVGWADWGHGMECLPLFRQALTDGTATMW